MANRSPARLFLLNLLAMLSLSLSIATAVLWWRSTRLRDTWTWLRTTAPGDDHQMTFHEWRVILSGGGLHVACWTGYSEEMDATYARSSRANRITHEVGVNCSYPQLYRFRLGQNETVDSRELLNFWGYKLQRYSWHFTNSHAHLNGTNVIFPLWLPLALFFLYPALREVARYHERARTRRRTAGLCVACGYDLRASTNRCPECGTPFPSQATA